MSGGNVLTVRNALELPELRAGRPRVAGGASGLDRPIRWVHVSELFRVAELLHGGELVLTTGLGLDHEPDRLEAWIEQLATAGACGVVLELGDQFSHTPERLRAAADEHSLPLVELHQEVRFVDITLAVHSRILSPRLDHLQRADEVQRVFHQLVIEGASPVEILERAAAMVDRPLVLENLSHQVVAVAPAPTPLDRLLARWEERSRHAATMPRGADAHEAVPDGPTVVAEGPTIVAVEGRHGRVGRLAMMVSAPNALERTVLERAADAVALTRGRGEDPRPLDALAHGSLLADLMARRWSTADDVVVRARALGVELADHALVGIVARFPDEDGQATSARVGAGLVRRAVRAVHPAALVATLDRHRVAVLASLATDGDVDDTIEQIASAIHARAAPSGAVDVVTIGAGPVAHGIAAAADSLQEAGLVADGAAATAPPRSYHTMRDIRIRGLVHLLRDDQRVQAFVERELGPLLRHDADHDTRLVRTLRTWLEQGGNKSAAAEALYLSRPALYQRLEQVELVLDRRLDDVESRLSLHVAVLALDAMRADRITVDTPS